MVSQDITGKGNSKAASVSYQPLPASSTASPNNSTFCTDVKVRIPQGVTEVRSAHSDSK